MLFQEPPQLQVLKRQPQDLPRLDDPCRLPFLPPVPQEQPG
jgi:hypothetical protein